MRDRLTFGWEPLAVLLEDGLAAIVCAHWDEVAVHPDKMPLAVDWDKYQDLEDKGILKVMGARRGDKLIGYSSFMVMPHLHYSTTLHAANDAIYVDPAERGVGIKLIRESERALAELAKPGWCRILYHAKFHVEAGRGTLAKVFDKLGYNGFETVHDKMVKSEP